MHAHAVCMQLQGARQTHINKQNQRTQTFVEPIQTMHSAVPVGHTVHYGGCTNNTLLIRALRFEFSYIPSLNSSHQLLHGHLIE
jgi:hypothetical protein